MDDDERSRMPISFPHLSKLNIWGCPLLTSVPLCPTVEDLNLYYFNESLEIPKDIESGVEGAVDTVTPKLRVARIDDVGILKSLPMPFAFQSLFCMWIVEDEKVENLREVEDIFWSCSSSLQKLEINKCRKVRSISGALEHLTALKDLTLLINSDIINDDIIRCRLEEDDGDKVAWSALQNCLHYLVTTLDFSPYPYIGRYKSCKDNTRMDYLLIFPPEIGDTEQFTRTPPEMHKPRWIRLPQNSTHPQFSH